MNEPNKTALVCGASFAGLSTAYWLRELGYRVTLVENAKALRTGGTAVNIEGRTVDVARRMGILEPIRAQRLSLERLDYKTADDVTASSMVVREKGALPPENDLEIERNVLLGLLHDLVKRDAEFLFETTITALRETPDAIVATLRDGRERTFDLVFGCDGLHSTVRKTWFGHEAEYVKYLEQYFAISIIDASLAPPNTIQMYNEPGRVVMLNAYKDKTDIVLGFVAEKEIPYDYRDEAAQRKIIAERFSGMGWRAAEMLEAMEKSPSFYFDKLCQVRMPSWTKGRVALVGDAGYCASPAAGKGGSLALDGAAALGDALRNHPEDHARAFAEYDASFRPYIEGVQAAAVKFGLEGFCPRTEEAIRKRNSGEIRPFESSGREAQET